MTGRIAIAAALAVVCGAWAARAEEETPGRRPALSLEVDPAPFFMGGWSVAAGAASGRLRWSVNSFAYDVPSFAAEPGWRERVELGFGARVQLYLRDGARGFYGGMQAGVRSVRFEREGSEGMARVTQIDLLPHVGYRWFTGLGGLYLMPAAGLDVLLWSSPASAGGAPVPTSRFAPVLALHVGYEL